ncbi:MAG: RNA polymerase sigma factor [Oscillospiraceae bacterium]|nr:RNA polymerase sigma factor [Oscillospiraceae bacterium]
MLENSSHNAFRKLYLPLHATLFKTALAILRDRNNAEDALQEALLRGYKNFAKLRNQTHFKTWMTRILINTCRDFRRRNPEQLSLDIAAHIPVPDDGEERLHVLECIQRLDQKTREIITLRFWSQLTQEEIAEVMSLPIGTVKSRLSRALSKLKTLLEEDET